MSMTEIEIGGYLMKNNKRRLISATLALILIFCTLLLSGCYIVDSGAMSDVVGTYKLTNYYTDEDMIAARGICLYIVIKADGTGYYAYSDNDTELYFSELRCRYTQDTEEPGHYSYVELDFRGDGGDWFNLGINSGAGTLNARKPKYKGNLFEGNLEIDYYIDVDFRRVSSATDLAYLTMQLGYAKCLPFAALRLDGSYYYAGVTYDAPEGGEVYDPFVYFYLTLDLYSDTGRVWYMLKSDEVAKNEQIDLSVAASDDGYLLTLGEDEVRGVVNGSYVQYVSIPYEFMLDGVGYDGEITLNFTGYLDDSTREIQMAGAVQAYQDSKMQE